MQQSLLDWFADQGRSLPWRQTRDPYRILVAEIMLQQTQVSRVTPKYLAFLEQFPDVAALASAPTADVIRQWTGLGYNRRALNLQRTARVVVDSYGGVFPRDVMLLRQLPGIGPYTAGAIACFAFEQDVAFIDTNIRRVIQRLLAESSPPGSDARLIDLARMVLPSGRGWAWNQAIMELGALICTPTPVCWRCPVRAYCRDYDARRRADEQLLYALPVQTPTTLPARRLAESTETRYLGSSRFYRGRIVELLRGLGPGETLAIAELCQQIRPDGSQEQLAELRVLIAGLERDGLIVVRDDQISLP